MFLNAPIYFHVGYPKAASTSLQKKLFARDDSLINLGLYPSANVGVDFIGTFDEKTNYENDPRIAQIYHAIGQIGSIEFDLIETKNKWLDIANDYIPNELGNCKPVVLSHESITSARFASPEIIDKARRIRDVFGDIRIIIIIRSQQGMLKSLYRDHPYDPRYLGQRAKFVRFSDWLNIDLNRGALSLARTMYFNRVTEIYEELFGEQNVLVLPMEWLSQDLLLFSNKISEFMRLDPESTFSLLKEKPQNRGVSNAGNKYRVFRSKMVPFFSALKPFKKPLSNIDAYLFNRFKRLGKTSSIKISDQDEKILSEMYASDNGKLADRRNIPLGDLGYYFN